ncbi:MAG: YbjQ family protein [Candidatus Omnitrophica bacterium]|nr:YbjQ family protein [Candidatus Omnitrophota bacterium]
MITTNIETVPGKRIVEQYGIVQGSTVRAKNVGVDCVAGCQNTFGGELKGYSQLLEESRQEAVGRMIAEAEQLGANAIVNVRFGTSTITQGASEILAYGTAVRVE